MKNLHVEKILIDDTNVDFNMKVPSNEIIRLLQVSTFNHSQLIGLDHKTMEQKSQAFSLNYCFCELQNHLRPRRIYSQEFFRHKKKIHL